ncbi:RagB/SusD family nutrient uptake outer membrane protein [Marinilabilia rubra]|uniref:RagB/SusD family nutrient uptake outer membrane protein n=1 Tax=Marinilabilia rubra TaxID=2162893 RepID=A0A2U2B7B6_9BACT|nr:RagB/SusD family nutrient uptake outer membrane protein [Marinilabilia rubra]PWD98958.1 RagB/SusD family nutrient uptake outer membrane protein [Marinilabilia rubra]
MNILKKYFVILGILLAVFACNDTLELEPLDKVSGKVLFETEEGIKTVVADMYKRIPVENFWYRPTGNFAGFNNKNAESAGAMIATDHFTDDACLSHGSGWSLTANYWPYGNIRYANIFLETVEESKGNLSEPVYNRLISEGHFFRAYIYFGMAKRYGGVPLIDRLLDDEYQPGSDNENLNIPRSTEKETFDFILADLDEAVKYLPESTPPDKEGKFRATKWAAYGLMSRVALFAASTGKYNSNADVAGEAFDKKLAFGITPAEADEYYQKCISASEAIIDNSGKSLFQPNPGSPAEAAFNFLGLFHQDITDGNEIIFKQGFIPEAAAETQGHRYDGLNTPHQLNQGYHVDGRYSVSLDIVDVFEDYSDDGSGNSVKVKTRTDGNESYTFSDISDGFDADLPFIKYDSPLDAFADKDARLHASVMLPYSNWRNTEIVVQGGLITPTGTQQIFVNQSAQGLDGNTYYVYGAAGNSLFSGFYGLNFWQDGNYYSTGFGVKKYLDIKDVDRGRNSDTDWIDIRLAEIYLNYAEAVIESGSGDAAKARNLLNALRQRAGHTDNIPLTLENVLKERRVELAFEGHRYWDLMRRRDVHELFQNYKREALVPVLDLRENPPKYILVRTNQYHDERAGGRTVFDHEYYRPIPGRNTNNLIDNPNYN